MNIGFICIYVRAASVSTHVGLGKPSVGINADVTATGVIIVIMFISYLCNASLQQATGRFVCGQCFYMR